MTIIEPNKSKSKVKRFIGLVLTIVFIGAIFSIQIYNANVDLKYSLSTQEKKLDQLEVINAELKDRLYDILDSNNLRSQAQELGLILEKNPLYLETESQVVASNL